MARRLTCSSLSYKRRDFGPEHLRCPEQFAPPEVVKFEASYAGHRII